ncbi:MAG: SigB/SigF/SigG family RNA polymerase sigma factor [Actinobacteria bacterium]|nr:SigB/SigF/SigG family RNA polymerase sigma factor [Actinomycetota bacterium]MSW23969.1 SigB/SigF/SigG family RNA polymerase sigma factor [Actinomycetota bacterium]MSX29664.1 SigB/SigF/SigG family RNA polymerase sigma factor [Actinomycetota bacterium]MSX44043.1 SigB/SigF/SigG family RNA polymerase sigma factor [Actinomycetota bacterium]MSX96764.1 SigB/SigF/SigG family RNA polymerase sigma factor [Actinomycetota bacterium]
MFEQLAALEAGTTEHESLRAALIERHLPLVTFMARKFADRGEPLDDLIQVGTIGLIKAIDRFEISKGFEFSTFATPTIVGEIKRHFRDKTWAIRVPRRLQELGAAITKANNELTQKLDRSPTPKEIAKHLGVTVDEIAEALESNAAYSTVSLDSGSDESPTIGDSVGSLDEALEGVEYRESLKPLLAALDDREKRILQMRFFDNLSQSQIATELGISQMHVSRILTKVLSQLRTGLVEN